MTTDYKLPEKFWGDPTLDRIRDRALERHVSPEAVLTAVLGITLTMAGSPVAVMLTGPVGCGKSAAAEVAQEALSFGDRSTPALYQLNSATGDGWDVLPQRTLYAAADTWRLYGDRPELAELPPVAVGPCPRPDLGFLTMNLQVRIALKMLTGNSADSPATKSRAAALLRTSEAVRTTRARSLSDHLFVPNF